MAEEYDGLTLNSWPGTWVPSGDHPIVLDSHVRGGLRYISGQENDRLKDIPGEKVQPGMLVYIENGYTEDGEVYEPGTFYQYSAVAGENRNANNGRRPNAKANWHKANMGGSSEGSLVLNIKGTVNSFNNLQNNY